MNSKPIRYAVAAAVAQQVVDRLKPGCAQVAIAGACRRRRPLVQEIEIVAVPAAVTDAYLFGPRRRSSPRKAPNLLRDSIERARVFFPPDKPCDGERYKRYSVYFDAVPGRHTLSTVETDQKIGVSLFLTSAESWGYELAIRTGPAVLSQLMIMRLADGGLLHNGYRCEGGQVWKRGEVGRGDSVAVKTEGAFFELLGCSMCGPEDREDLVKSLSRK